MVSVSNLIQNCQKQKEKKNSENIYPAPILHHRRQMLRNAPAIHGNIIHCKNT